MNPKSILIIGGGIQGRCAAYYLVKEGFNVKIIDPKTDDTGASYVNAGYLTPSHIISIANKGMIKKGLKWMFNSSSPFYLKPRLDLDFIDWLWKFYQSATPGNVERSIPVIRDINILSKDLYSDMHNSMEMGNFQLDESGVLMLYKTNKAGDHEAAVAQRLIADGLAASILNRQQLDQLQPDLNEEVLGAIHYKCDAHTTPTELMPKLKTYLESKGVEFIHEEVIDFRYDGSSIKEAITTQNNYAAEAVVMAAGSWSQGILKKLKLHMPIQAGKGYRIDLYRETPVKYSAIFLEAKCAITPMKGFTRFAGTMELSGINNKVRKERVEAIAKASENHYNNLKITEEEKNAARFGNRPVSPDGLPYIGKSKDFDNLYLATGHAMMGWSLAPATGKLISELLTNKKTSMSIEAFHPDRFR
ncbi:MAG: FAD-dependent oxidoreductase [Flavobacteriaceae bacterium]|jgi:D-amino-acid dehydrogenase|nr:FAD-dependent oxidoreductase [Flavobacteriaceae bacterium]